MTTLDTAFVRDQFPPLADGWVFVEAHVQFRLCRLCGDAILPCEACSSLSCSNGLCAAAIHAGCPALREA